MAEKIKVITVTNQPPRAEPLIRSLEKNNWDYECIVTEWRGFGTKLIETYNYLKAHPEVTEFVFCDGHDVVCLAGEAEFREKLRQAGNPEVMLSAERGCWPITQNHVFYVKYPHGFNYPNSGLYYAKSDVFIKVFESNTPEPQFDDQIWWQTAGLAYSFDRPWMLDSFQKIFNSHSFIAEGEYTYDNGRSTHNTLGTSAVFLHGNGGGLPKEVYALIM